MAVIVVAEDEFLLADMLVISLEDAGHSVFAAPNGKAALAAAIEHNADLIITDFMMPVWTGLEFATAVRQTAGISDVPIILVSGAQASIARGHPEIFDAVVDKPYALEGLLELVERLLRDGRGGD
ncbi:MULTISPECIES: response regulator [unclassified Chelatococcus]|uniref:response regulator n=1 Tax=unclassified Chelatococcus TaxID=2638111 RepID=UPI001BCD1350|nr:MULTISPECIES: response regulator [unclassified Chelatococcus]MBS7700431.1 response regulator [Chelatococcus sp. YT9]MBX3556227.1 response regulator [Chelatococcus sp.]